MARLAAGPAPGGGDLPAAVGNDRRLADRAGVEPLSGTGVHVGHIVRLRFDVLGSREVYDPGRKVTDFAPAAQLEDRRLPGALSQRRDRLHPAVRWIAPDPPDALELWHRVSTEACAPPAQVP